MRRPGGGVLVAAVASTLLLIALIGSRHPARAAARVTPPPWPAPAQLAEAVQAARLPLLPAPGQVVRYVVHLDVVFDGRPVIVPAGIGVDYRARRISPLHTYDTSGVIHVEADSDGSAYTLGQFFAEWQVPLGGRAAGSPAVYVNGSRVAGDPDSAPLAPHQEIVVRYGRAVPGSVPSGYAFPAGA